MADDKIQKAIETALGSLGFVNQRQGPYLVTSEEVFRKTIDSESAVYKGVIVEHSVTHHIGDALVNQMVLTRHYILEIRGGKLISSTLRGVWVDDEGKGRTPSVGSFALAALRDHIEQKGVKS